MINIGDQLPDFVAKNQDGADVKASSFLGEKLVIFFYPQASTPTCTVEACNFRDGYAELRAAGYQILGISADGEKKQKNFHAKHGFPFDLIADENKELVELFGVWKEKKNFGKTYMGIVRTTFVFDEQGICVRIIDKVKSKEATAQILEG